MPPYGTWVPETRGPAREHVFRDCWPCLHHQVRAFARPADLADSSTALTVTGEADLAVQRWLGWSLPLAALVFAWAGPWWSEPLHRRWRPAPLVEGVDGVVIGAPRRAAGGARRVL